MPDDSFLRCNYYFLWYNSSNSGTNPDKVSMAKEDYKVVSLPLHREHDKELIDQLAQERNTSEKIRQVLKAHYTKKEKRA